MSRIAEQQAEAAEKAQEEKERVRGEMRANVEELEVGYRGRGVKGAGAGWLTGW